jgi:hypothetical protein
VEDKVICLYAMHRYDLVFYARLIEVLNFLDVKIDFQLFITGQVFHIPNTQDFIHRTFPNYLIVPTKLNMRVVSLKNIFTFVNLRGWVKSHINQESVLVLTDKSSPLSRSFLKQSSNAVLIQQIEEIGGDYTFDLKAYILNSNICMVLGAYFSRWYVSHSSGG